MEASSMNLFKHFLPIFCLLGSNCSRQQCTKKLHTQKIDFLSHFPPISKLPSTLCSSSQFFVYGGKKRKGRGRKSSVNNHSLITNSTSLFFHPSNTWLILFPSERIIVYLISHSRDITTYFRLSLSCFCRSFLKVNSTLRSEQQRLGW